MRKSGLQVSLVPGERGERMIYTVFPKDEGEMPQDFPTYSDAKEYGDGEFGKGNYTIEFTEGECV